MKKQRRHRAKRCGRAQGKIAEYLRTSGDVRSVWLPTSGPPSCLCSPFKEHVCPGRWKSGSPHASAAFTATPWKGPLLYNLEDVLATACTPVPARSQTRKRTDTAAPAAGVHVARHRGCSIKPNWCRAAQRTTPHSVQSHRGRSRLSRVPTSWRGR